LTSGKDETMSEVTRKLIDRTGRNMSRRGFMALAGKVVAALGVGMAGAGWWNVREAWAGMCCTGLPFCVNCPPTGGCPAPTCTAVGSPTVCCDTGYIGATDTIHQCQVCDCQGVGNCLCEYDTGNSCP
jgi:hypothetical protein